MISLDLSAQYWAGKGLRAKIQPVKFPQLLVKDTPAEWWPDASPQGTMLPPNALQDRQ